MIADKDERVCHSERTETGGQGDLRCLVHNTVVKLAAEEERTRRCQTRQ